MSFNNHADPRDTQGGIQHTLESANELIRLLQFKEGAGALVRILEMTASKELIVGRSANDFGEYVKTVLMHLPENALGLRVRMDGNDPYCAFKPYSVIGDREVTEQDIWNPEQALDWMQQQALELYPENEEIHLSLGDARELLSQEMD